MKRPNCSRYWTSLYYGARGSGKTLHQAREMLALLRYLHKLYKKRPLVHRAIVITNQKLAPELERLYLNKDVFYFDDNDIETMRFCPRKNCWRGLDLHKIHGCYLFIDDISNILPALDWQTVPKWLRRLWVQGRKRGVHFVATLIDPFDLVVQARRCTDIAYKFRPIFKTRDPDETMPALKHIFGWYQRRVISAEMLWKYGDLPEQIIQLKKIEQEQMHERLREMDKAYAIVYDNNWSGAVHFFNRSGRFPNWRHFPALRVSSVNTYDTLQDVASKDE